MAITEEVLFGELTADAYQIVETLIAKRRDYGSTNLAITGEVGLAARIVDKAHRVWNLTSLPRGPNYEPLEDSVKDLIGYCLIYLRVMGGDEW